MQSSAQKGEGLEAQLRPVERYAVRWLEDVVNILGEAVQAVYTTR